MHRTLIDWSDYSWNPVWGCLRGCPYCYAAALAHRLGKSFEPHWMQANFASAMPKKPSRIFVNSMSDILYWRVEWWEPVLRRIRENPQHTFLFLTKSPGVYAAHEFPANALRGVTATTRTTALGALFHRPDFLSIEPILERIDPAELCGHGLRWVILGAETGNRRERVVPPSEWIAPWLELPMPLYMKKNLPWPGPWRKEYPV